MHIVLPSPGRLAAVLGTAAALLVAIHLALQAAVLAGAGGAVGAFARLFHLDAELTVPAWFASTTLLLCALVLAAIGLATRPAGPGWWRWWLALAVIFGGLSLDEAIALHERTVRPLRVLLGASGIFYYTWVVPGAAFAAAVGIASVRFLRHLPRATRVRFVVAGAVYVGGALGMELASGWRFEGHGEADPAYVLLSTVEESLEMAGIVLLLHALLAHVQHHVGEIRITVGERRPAAPPSAAVVALPRVAAAGTLDIADAQPRRVATGRTREAG